MTAKKQLGIMLMGGCIAAFLFWSLQPPPQIGTLLRSLVAGLLAVGAFLAWTFLVRPARKS